MKLEAQIKRMALSAQKAARGLALVSTEEKNKALQKMADCLDSRRAYILDENRKDLARAEAGRYPPALVDRLALNDRRIDGMIESLREVEKLPDPVGEVLEQLERPNGLKITKVRTPIGVIAIIYESRPNVTADCAGLCLKAGNAVILKGGREAEHSNAAIFRVLQAALAATAVPQAAIQLLAVTDRRALRVLLGLNAQVDLVIPRGGEGLIKFVAGHSRIPVIKHYKGVCHTYVSAHADLASAQRICMNAKVQRPGVCNAMETMLVDRKVAERFLPAIVADMQKAGVEIRGCPATRRIIGKGVKRATENDWYEEYLDLILSVRVVDSLAAAIEHINTYGSHHSDAIVTKDAGEAVEFCRAVDSACVYANASTRFTDGYEFGMGAEIGISTDKLHARGPMALKELTTYKYIVTGQGQVRA